MYSNINEQKVEPAFTQQSFVFDKIYGENVIINYKRNRVREHFLKYIKPNSSILEINSGTGEDAIFFAQRGHHVHATDISAGMQQILKNKIQENNLESKISNELCSFTDLDQIKNKGPYDAIFSNFAGLNCTNELDKVLVSFNVLLKPGGIITLVILPKFCLWETLLLLKGKWKTATRRFFKKHGCKANVEGKIFKCWYYNPSFIIKNLKNNYNLLSIEGLCTLVPPSYMDVFAEKYAGLYKFLKQKEDVLKTKWPWKFIGDYYIISFRKKENL